MICDSDSVFTHQIIFSCLLAFGLMGLLKETSERLKAKSNEMTLRAAGMDAHPNNKFGVVNQYYRSFYPFLGIGNVHNVFLISQLE